MRNESNDIIMESVATHENVMHMNANIILMVCMGTLTWSFESFMCAACALLFLLLCGWFLMVFITWNFQYATSKEFIRAAHFLIKTHNPRILPLFETKTSGEILGKLSISVDTIYCVTFVQNKFHGNGFSIIVIFYHLNF